MTQKEKIIKILKDNKHTLKKMYGVNSLYLYGSFSRGDFSKNSDIDVLVDVAKNNKTYIKYFLLKDYLRKRFNKKVDVVYKDSINPIVKFYSKKEWIKIG
jgi:uncharacterized protein